MDDIKRLTLRVPSKELWKKFKVLLVERDLSFQAWCMDKILEELEEDEYEKRTRRRNK